MHYSDPVALQSAKKVLRRDIRRRLAELSASSIKEMSRSISRRVLDSDSWRAAGTVCLFASMSAEVQTEAICREALAQRKRLALPRVGPDGLIFHLVDRWPFPAERSPYGIDEPAASLPRLDHLSVLAGHGLTDTESSGGGSLLVVTPGLAFDLKGGRLGQGAGYYDRFFASLGGGDRWTAIGVAFGTQVIDAVPRGPHDLAVHRLATENGILSCGP